MGIVLATFVIHSVMPLYGRHHVVDLTLAIVLRAQSLYDIPEPGDRLVAATAMELDCPVVTKDIAIAQAPGVDAMW